MALPTSPSGPASLAKGQDEFESRESYSSLRSRWGVDNFEDDPRPSYDIASPSNSTTTASEASPSRSGNGKGKSLVRSAPVPNGMMNPLKSISELRNKGESRRFLDEVGYLFEGLDPKCGIALRRSRSVSSPSISFCLTQFLHSTLEITTKLCDPEFTRKAKAADFFARTWELLLLAGAGKGDDKVYYSLIVNSSSLQLTYDRVQILDILLAFFLALVARDPVSLTELAERPMTTISSGSHLQHNLSLVDILVRILENVSSDGDLLVLSDQNSHRDGLDLRTPKIPKKDRVIVRGLYSYPRQCIAKARLFLQISSIHKVITSKSFLFSPSIPVSRDLL